MRSKNRPKYYEAGGLLEMLTESSPTTLFEQRTKDRVARDLLRNEVEKPPRMMLSRGGLAGLLRRASGGMIPGYAFGGSMAGAYGGSPMKGPEDQPFGQKGGGWGSTPTAPAQGAGTFTPGPAPGGTGGIGTGIGGPGQAGPQPQQMQQQGQQWTSYEPPRQSLPYGQPQQAMQAPSPSNTYGLTQAQIGRGQRQTQQMQAGRPEQDQLQYRTGFSPASPDRLPPSGPQQMQPRGRQSFQQMRESQQMGQSLPSAFGEQQVGYSPQLGLAAQQQAQQAALSARRMEPPQPGGGLGQMSLAQGPPGGFRPGGNIMYNNIDQSAPQSPGGAANPFGASSFGPDGQEYVPGLAAPQPGGDLGPTDPYAGTGGPGAPQPQAGPTYQAQALPEGYGSPTSYAGYGGPESFDSRQEFVSPEVASQYADLTDSIMAVGTKPYEQYEGPQLASFTPEEKAAQDATAIYGTSEGPQGTLQAESTLDQAATSIGQVGADSQALAKTSAERTREIGGEDAALGKDADMSEYMSDYTQNVTDPQLRQLMEFQKQQGQELGSQAAASGAFGGYRQGIMQGQQAQQASQQAADIIGKGQQEAFQSAIGRERDDAQRTEAAYARQLGTEKQASATEAAAQNQMLSASQAMANVGTAQTALGRQQQDQLQSRLREMQKSGASKRQLDQAALDIQKQQWEQRQQRPERQVAWMNQQLGMLPYQNIVQQGSYSPQAGPVASAIGTGVQSLGMWEAWKARQAAGERTPQQNANDRAYDRRQAYADIGATATPYDSPNQPPYSPPIAAPNIPTGLRPMDYSNPTMDWANENYERMDRSKLTGG